MSRYLKVPEYILFDPTGDHLPLRLRGLRLVDGVYVEIEMTNGRLYSEQLGLELVPDGIRLRFFDPVQGRYLPTLEESEAQRQESDIRRQEAETQRQKAEARVTVEQTARQEAEGENERLRRENAELRRLLAAREE